MDCPHCTGSAYLCDNEALGPCTCVTPQTVRDLSEMYADAERECESLRDEANALRDQADAATIAHDQEMTTAEADWRAENDFGQLLADYLNSIDLPVSAVRYENPHLDALVQAIRP